MLNPWVLLGEAITVALLVCAPFLWRNRGAVFGLRWSAVALLPAGLALTGLLRLFGTVGRAFVTFFSRTAFAPTVWIGYALIAVAVGTWFVARAVSARGVVKRASDSPRVVAPAGGAPKIGRSPARTAPASASADDEFAEVEAILRRRGI